MLRAGEIIVNGKVEITVLGWFTTQTPTSRIRLCKLHAILGFGAPVGGRDTV